MEDLIVLFQTFKTMFQDYNIDNKEDAYRLIDIIKEIEIQIILQNEIIIKLDEQKNMGWDIRFGLGEFDLEWGVTAERALSQLEIEFQGDDSGVAWIEQIGEFSLRSGEYDACICDLIELGDEIESCYVDHLIATCLSKKQIAYDV